MENVLYRLYKQFYHPEKSTPEAGRIADNHRAVVGRLGKQERKLVLRITDDKDLLIVCSSYNAFVSGFRLAMEIMTEINNKDDIPTGQNRAE